MEETGSRNPGGNPKCVISDKVRRLSCLLFYLLNFLWGGGIVGIMGILKKRLYIF